MDIILATQEHFPEVQSFDSHIPSGQLRQCIGSGWVYILRDGSQIAGTLRYSLFWQAIPFLDLILLSPAYRGRGYGSRMMAHWEEEMTSRGYRYVMLSTQADETAKDFYEKLGYRRIGAFLPPEQEAEELMYLKELDGMSATVNILRCHGKRYPLMQPQDAVKLLYQNEFGGGHLIADKDAFFRYLEGEYRSVEKDTSLPLLEDIGNGWVRVMLPALQEAELEPLGQAFLQSAAEFTGSLPRFRQKLELLRHLTGNGIFSFSPEELDAYLAEYEKEGFPMVSHSEIYRSAYRPAYRIVLRSRLNLRQG